MWSRGKAGEIERVRDDKRKVVVGGKQKGGRIVPPFH